MNIPYRGVPAVTAVEANGRVWYYRVGEPSTGRTYHLVIVRFDHPALLERHASAWLNHDVRPCLSPTGTWLEVWQ